MLTRGLGLHSITRGAKRIATFNFEIETRSCTPVWYYVSMFISRNTVAVIGTLFEIVITHKKRNFRDK